jgi:hypothetical protein
MLRPSQRYRAYLEYLKVWWPLAMSIIERLPQDLNLEAALDRSISELGSEQPGVRVREKLSPADDLQISIGFTLRSYFIALGQLWSFLDAASLEWPDRVERRSRDLTKYIVGRLFDPAESVPRHLVSSLIRRLWADTPVPLDKIRDIEDLCDLLCEFHRLTCLERAAGRIADTADLPVSTLVEKWTNALRSEIETLPPDAREELAKRMRSYLNNHFVLKSLPPREVVQSLNREFLISVATQPGERMFKINIEGLLAQVPDPGLDDDLRRQLANIFLITHLAQPLGVWYK